MIIVFFSILSVIIISIILIALLFHLFGTPNYTWTQKDIDKQYGFMCYRCEIPLEDGEGVPRRCEECENKFGVD